MNPILEFEEARTKRISQQGQNQLLTKIASELMEATIHSGYSYNFSWMGRPIIQYPQDMIAMQELIWEVQPDVIIETGIAHGGSILFYASLLELIGKGIVVGVDIEIREHNRKAIESHPMYKRVRMIEGSSISHETIEKVKSYIPANGKVIVCLDSNHSHEHVLNELLMYAPLVSLNSYLVVFDTIVEYLPEGLYSDRNWDKGNNPMTAIITFLEGNDDFVVCKEIDNKLLLSAAPSGYLKRVK
jgi:cephalosporin hydroxylase